MRFIIASLVSLAVCAPALADQKPAKDLRRSAVSQTDTSPTGVAQRLYVDTRANPWICPTLKGNKLADSRDLCDFHGGWMTR